MSNGKDEANCAHCMLSDVLQVFLLEHPNGDPSVIFQEILQVAAEYLASTLPTAQRAASMSQASLLLREHLTESFHFVDTNSNRRH